MKIFLLASVVSIVASFAPVAKPNSKFDLLHEGANVNEMVSRKLETKISSQTCEHILTLE